MGPPLAALPPHCQVCHRHRDGGWWPGVAPWHGDCSDQAWAATFNLQPAWLCHRSDCSQRFLPRIPPQDPVSAANGAHGICIMTEWDEFKHYDYEVGAGAGQGAEGTERSIRGARCRRLRGNNYPRPWLPITLHPHLPLHRPCTRAWSSPRSFSTAATSWTTPSCGVWVGCGGRGALPRRGAWRRRSRAPRLPKARLTLSLPPPPAAACLPPHAAASSSPTCRRLPSHPARPACLTIAGRLGSSCTRSGSRWTPSCKR